MKKIFGSFVLAAALIVAMFSFGFAKGFSQLLGSFVVDIEQSVPILADVIVIDKNGDEVEATIPLTVSVKMSVLIDGAEATVLPGGDPSVTVEKKEPISKRVSDGEAIVEGIDIPYVFSVQGGISIVGVSGIDGMFGKQIQIEIENVGDSILKSSNATISAHDKDNNLLFVSPLNHSGDAIVPGDKTVIEAGLFMLETMGEDTEIGSLYIQVTGEFQQPDK